MFKARILYMIQECNIHSGNYSAKLMQFTQQCSWNLFKILGKQGIQKWLFLKEAPKNIYTYGQKMNNHYDNMPLTCKNRSIGNLKS